MLEHEAPHHTARSVKDYVFICMKGMAMGAADIVPGVSGGTIALITGIYQELLASLKRLTPLALSILLRSGFRAFWKYINGAFLLALFSGILLSLKTLASVVSWALTHHSLLVWGMFSGLIVASLYCLYREQSRWAALQYVLFILGAMFVVAIAIAKPTQVPGDWWMLFLGGFVAICAMILPGISGSFILLLIGLYPVFLGAIERLDLLALASFAGGCICGLLVFSRFLSWLLDKFYNNTLAVMMGFLLGSLYVTWPWKHVVSTTVNRHDEVVPLIQQNISPFVYEAFTGANAHLVGVGVAALVGFFLVLIVDKVSSES